MGETKILGIIDHVYVGEVTGYGIAMVVKVKTYLYGDHTFFYSIEDMNKFITQYHIPDISLLFGTPVILSRGKDEPEFKLHEICENRRF
jgi:hypothetical protein